MNGEVVIFAAEGVMAQEAVETFRRLDMVIAAAVVTAKPEWDMMGLAHVIDPDAVSDSLASLPAIVPVWAPARRRQAVRQARAAGFTDFPAIVDPTATVAQTARLSEGVYVHTGANIGAGAEIGEFALINRAALISHHCVLDSFVTTGAGAVLSSRCRAGEACVLGANSTVIPNRVIGDNAIVSAGAVVMRDVAAGVTVIGNPARPVLGRKTKSAGEMPGDLEEMGG